MNTELITLITLIAGFLAIIKFLFDLNKENHTLENKLNDFRDELRKGNSEIKIEIVKLQHRFDVSEGEQKQSAEIKADTIKHFEKQITEIKTDVATQAETTNQRFIQIETEQKANFKELIHAFSDNYGKKTVL